VSDKLIALFWSFYWRAFVYTFAAGFAIGMVDAVANNGRPSGVVGLVVVLASIPAQFFALKHALNRNNMEI